MSVTKSFNHQTNTTYAYETTYEWSDEKQKKVQKKRCIGQFNPETGEIIPNGRRGRPSGSVNAQRDNQSPSKAEVIKQTRDLSNLNHRLDIIESTLMSLSQEIHKLKVQTERDLGE